MRNKFHFLLAELSIFLLIPFTLSSCYFIGILLSEHPKTEADEIMIQEYYEQFVLPKDPYAKLGDVDYYEFLSSTASDEHKLSIFCVWQVFEDTSEWSLKIENIIFYFYHKIEFFVFDLADLSFHNIQEKVDEEIFSLEEVTRLFEYFEYYKNRFTIV